MSSPQTITMKEALVLIVRHGRHAVNDGLLQTADTQVEYIYLPLDQYTYLPLTIHWGRLIHAGQQNDCVRRQVIPHI